MKNDPNLNSRHLNVIFFVMTLVFCFGLAVALIASMDIIDVQPGRTKPVEATLFSSPDIDMTPIFNREPADTD